MSQARNFTLELTQEGTGKKATVTVNQQGFTPVYVFKWDKTDETNINLTANVSGVINNIPLLISHKLALTMPVIRTVEYSYITSSDNIINQIDVTPSHSTVLLLPNPTYEKRIVKITFTQEESGQTLSLTITQDAKADDGVFEAHPTTLSFNARQTTKSSTITSTSKGQTVGWSITNKSSIPSWLTVSGEGTSQLSATVKDNE